MEDSVKVDSTTGFGPTRATVAFLAVVVALAIGTSLVPTHQAIAAVDGPAVGRSAGKTLEPIEALQKTAEIRQPSGLVAIEEGAAATLTPTKMKRRIAPKATPSLAAAPATTDGWLRARVSWYGPGFYGHGMAGGGILQPDSMVVAHRSLPFGTRVEFAYKGNTCVAVVMDRGPYAGGRIFDLGPGTAAALGFSGVGTVEYRILN